ncbi:PREDICTED: uncharacterized protein LOC101296133 [Fragaria vesca subsp. vesca]
MELPVNTPKSATPVSSGQGSYSPQFERVVVCNRDAEVMAAKKKLILRDDVNVVAEERIMRAVVGKAKQTSILEEKLRDVFVPKASVNGEEECKLAVDSVVNIVAIGVQLSTLRPTSKLSMVFHWEMKMCASPSFGHWFLKLCCHFRSKMR